MGGELTGDDRCEDPTATIEDGAGRVVARCLDPQNDGLSWRQNLLLFVLADDPLLDDDDLLAILAEVIAEDF